MGLHVAQSETYQGHDRWNWAVWLEGTDAELDGVESVVWKLHRTFPQPVVRVTNRQEKFRIERVGWGTFTLGAEVRQHDGKTSALTHDLRLTYPPEEGVRRRDAGEEAPKQVFLSFAAEDQRFAAIVRDELEQAGLKVASSTDFSGEVPWDVMARKIIRKSDALVSLITTDTPSQFVQAEAQAATNAGLPVVALVREGVHPASITEQANLIWFAPNTLRETVQQVLARVKQEL